MEDFVALDKNATELTVMDVYDIAAVVGQEFERIINQFGCEALLRLMPKVVRVLEILEVLVTRNINSETEELRRELDMLRMERNDRLEKEKMHQRELELAEDVWRGEAQDLLSQITQLQVENKSLLKSLSLKNSPLTEEELQRQEGMAERERQMMKKLKEVVNKQREEVRDKDNELNLKNEELKALQLQHHHLKKINLGLQHRITLMETQGKGVMQQKAELEAMSQVRQQELATLRLELARLKQEDHGEELNRMSAAEEFLLTSTMTRPRPALSKSLVPASEASLMHNSFWAECRGDSEFLDKCFEPKHSPSPPALCDEELEEKPDALDQKESDRPCFTLQELQDVLQERNELKAQVFMLQEELIYYKSEELEDETDGITWDSLYQSEPATAKHPDSGIKRLIFTAVMPMVAAGLIADDPTLQPIRRLMSFT